MSASNLPPGCTSRDVDRAAGCYAACDLCGREVGIEHLNDDQLCARCAADESDTKFLDSRES